MNLVRAVTPLGSRCAAGSWPGQGPTAAVTPSRSRPSWGIKPTAGPRSQPTAPTALCASRLRGSSPRLGAPPEGSSLFLRQPHGTRAEPQAPRPPCRTLLRTGQGDRGLLGEGAAGCALNALLGSAMPAEFPPALLISGQRAEHSPPLTAVFPGSSRVSLVRH